MGHIKCLGFGRSTSRIPSLPSSFLRAHHCLRRPSGGPAGGECRSSAHPGACSAPRASAEKDRGTFFGLRRTPPCGRKSIHSFIIPFSPPLSVVTIHPSPTQSRVRHVPSQPYGLRHPTVHCLLVSCICALLAIYTDPPGIPISPSSPRGTGHLPSMVA